MTAVYFFTGAGHSLAAARFFARRLGTEVFPMEGDFPSSETAVAVFPVYCQNIPPPVKRFLRKLDAAYVVLIAVHGRISSGRVLYEASGLVSGTVIAGACVPTGHTFLREDASFDETSLLPVFGRIARPVPAHIPRTDKVWYADLFPGLRSRMSVRLLRTDACTGCNRCGECCPMGAMKRGKSGGTCIRCLRCVTACPRGALTFQIRPTLERYLRRHAAEENETILWL